MKAPKKSVNRRDFITRGSLSFGAIFAAGLPVRGLFLNRGSMTENSMIPTLTGTVDADNLGRTLMHEHVLFFSGPTPENPGYTPIPDDLRTETVDFAVSLLNDAARVGIETVVDLTPYRPIDLYEQIAKRTSVKIIASTGFYRRSKIPKWLADMDDEKQMEDHMLKEALEGIDGTKIRAGIIKIAEEGGALSDWEKKVFRAAARVNKAHGTPIATHTGNALEQFRFLEMAGVDPGRIFYSHVDVGRKGEPGDLITILKGGGYLEVDTFGQDFYTPWSDLVSFLRNICNAGFTNRIFISMDSNWHWGDGKKIFEGAEAPNFDPNAANRTFAYMQTEAVPRLLKSGFSMREIDTFLIDNPRNFFTLKS